MLFVKGFVFWFFWVFLNLHYLTYWSWQLLRYLSIVFEQLLTSQLGAKEPYKQWELYHSIPNILRSMLVMTLKLPTLTQTKGMPVATRRHVRILFESFHRYGHRGRSTWPLPGTAKNTDRVIHITIALIARGMYVWSSPVTVLHSRSNYWQIIIAKSTWNANLEHEKANRDRPPAEQETGNFPPTDFFCRTNIASRTWELVTPPVGSYWGEDKLVRPADASLPKRIVSGGYRAIFGGEKLTEGSIVKADCRGRGHKCFDRKQKLC